MHLSIGTRLVVLDEADLDGQEPVDRVSVRSEENDRTHERRTAVVAAPVVRCR